MLKISVVCDKKLVSFALVGGYFSLTVTLTKEQAARFAESILRGESKVIDLEGES